MPRLTKWRIYLFSLRKQIAMNQKFLPRRITLPVAADIAPAFLQILSDEARETRGQLLNAVDLLPKTPNDVH